MPNAPEPQPSLDTELDAEPEADPDAEAVLESNANSEVGDVEPDWSALLAAVEEPEPLIAKRHVRGPIAGSFSRPHVYLANGEEYVVKFSRPGGELRAIASDQVVGRAGRAIVAAVGLVEAVRIDATLLPPGEDPTSAGVSHGCRVIPHHTDGGVQHVDENRERMGSLAVLYTWTRAANHQLIYNQGSPPVVYSVDHGHFLPPETAWTAATLDAEPDPTALDSWFITQGVQPEDCASAAEHLRQLTPQDVVAIARSARGEWGVTNADRTAVCRFLWRRRGATLGLLSTA